MNHVATTLADSGYHACIVKACGGIGRGDRVLRSQSAG